MSSELFYKISEGSEAFLMLWDVLRLSGALSLVSSGFERFLKVLMGFLTF